MPAGPASVVQYLLVNHPLTAEPQRLHEAIVSVILAREWESHPSFATEQAEEWESAVAQRLRRNLNDLQEVGRPARISFNSSDQEFVQGACFVEPHDSAIVREQKQRRTGLVGYLKLIHGLEPQDFEHLCCRLLELFGVASPHLTRRTADDGIDFYGKLLGESVFFPHDLEPTIQKQLSIWLVGQAKQYINTRAGTPEIRDLVGAVMLGRAGVFSTNASPARNLHIRVSDPVFTVLVTGGMFSARAWKLIHRSGIVGIDGELLAAFLADREAGPGDSDAKAFRRWLRGCS